MWTLALAPSNTICHLFTAEKMTQIHRLRPGFFSWELRPATLWLNPLFLFSLISVSQPLSFLPPVFPVCPSFSPSLLPGHFLTVHWTSDSFSYLWIFEFFSLGPNVPCLLLQLSNPNCLTYTKVSLLSGLSRQLKSSELLPRLLRSDPLGFQDARWWTTLLLFILFCFDSWMNCIPLEAETMAHIQKHAKQERTLVSGQKLDIYL